MHSRRWIRGSLNIGRQGIMVFTRSDGIQKPYRRCRWANSLQKSIAKYLLRDMKENRLLVSLHPAPQPKHEGHMVRVKDSSNPEWYSILAQNKGLHKRRGKRRHGDLRIHVIEALKRMAKGFIDPVGLDVSIFYYAEDYLIRNGIIDVAGSEVLLEEGSIKSCTSTMQ